jgi:hypothetical protein
VCTLTKHGSPRFEDNAFYCARALDILNLLRAAFGRIHIVFDGLKVTDRDNIQADRNNDIASEYALHTARLQTQANTQETIQKRPLFLSACFYTALVKYARQHPDAIKLHQAEDEADTAAARLARKLAEDNNAAIPIYTKDSDLFFLKGCTVLRLAEVMLDNAAAPRGITVKLGPSWEERCRLLLGSEVDADSDEASLYMGTLAVVLGNDRVPRHIFWQLGPRRGGGTITTQGIQDWLAALRARVDHPEKLLNALLSQLQQQQHYQHHQEDIIRRAVQWYQPDEVQLPNLGMLAGDRQAIITALRDRDISVSMLNLVVERSFSVRCMYHPADYTHTSMSAWAQRPALVRVELVLCLLLDALCDWLQAQGWWEAAANFDQACITLFAKTARRTLEAADLRVSDLRKECRLINVAELKALRLPRAALALMVLIRRRVPELDSPNYRRALCQLVTLAEDLPPADAPCACVASGHMPERIPAELLSLLDTWSCCLDLLSFMSDLSPFAGSNGDERVLCTLYDPLALLHLSTKNIVCERHSYLPPDVIKQIESESEPRAPASSLDGARPLFNWRPAADEAAAAADADTDWRRGGGRGVRVAPRAFGARPPFNWRPAADEAAAAADADTKWRHGGGRGVRVASRAFGAAPFLKKNTKC